MLNRAAAVEARLERQQRGHKDLSPDFASVSANFEGNRKLIITEVHKERSYLFSSWWWQNQDAINGV